MLFSAQQFRSQVQRRVVGNAGTSVFGRMDMDELATPAYATLSPAIKIKLATLPKGELMLRHPHFTQPIFARFPRPAMLSGREGVERFPPGAELPFADAVARQLKQLDRRRRSRRGAGRWSRAGRSSTSGAPWRSRAAPARTTCWPSSPRSWVAVSAVRS